MTDFLAELDALTRALLEHEVTLRNIARAGSSPRIREMARMTLSNSEEFRERLVTTRMVITGPVSEAMRAEVAR